MNEGSDGRAEAQQPTTEQQHGTPGFYALVTETEEHVYCAAFGAHFSLMICASVHAGEPTDRDVHTIDVACNAAALGAVEAFRRVTSGCAS